MIVGTYVFILAALVSDKAKGGFMDYADEVDDNKGNRMNGEGREHPPDSRVTQRPLVTVKHIDPPEVLESDDRAFKTAHGATGLFGRNNEKELSKENRTHTDSFILSGTTEGLVHYDDKTDPDFPRRAPPARSLYNVPQGYSANKPYDYAFQTGFIKPVYGYSNVQPQPYLSRATYYSAGTIPATSYYPQTSQSTNWQMSTYYPYTNYYTYSSNYYYPASSSTFDSKYKPETIFMGFNKH